MSGCLKTAAISIAFFLLGNVCWGQNEKSLKLDSIFRHPPQEAKPWVFWYWMYAAVSKEGITADLEAMKQAGIGGAYLMPIYDTTWKVPYPKPARQLTPEWWAMVNHAMAESKRLGLKLAMHVSDGFALAGGPWIKPEQSMQKLVWTKTYLHAGATNKLRLKQPETRENFYKDIAVFAYPANAEAAFGKSAPAPAVTASTGEKIPWLAIENNDGGTFRSDSTCWIQYAYSKAFTLRSLKIHTGGNNYQAQRLLLQYSNDGMNFKTVMRLQPARHGWQDTDEDNTYSIPAITAKYFRFVYDKEGTEPGAEDLDAAKWKPVLKIKGIYLSDEPVINQIEAKNGSMWRIAENTTPEMVSNGSAVPLKNIINLTAKMDKDGNLNWQPPARGNWIILRMGHTSTGHVNATGGAAKGLECDKFNKDAVTLQFENWFAKAFEKTSPGLAAEVLKIFHVDSWEAGSQNWGKDFAAEFKKRRGYDLMSYLPVMAGVPIESATVSERVLHDVRETIAALINDVFYKTLVKLAHEKGCAFSAESVAPTMTSDGLLHYKTVDIPMGEFWLKSPTHDKPNDMLDAISSGHIYGKNVIQAEAFTTLRMDWSEQPGNIKALGDRNFAMGINKMVLHVFTHNPWMNRKPGMTLGGIGLFYQRDQTWFRQSHAWITYLARVSAMLQQGKPVTDIAVFTGEEVPRRSVLPDRLVTTLPGIFGAARVAAEKIRLENINQPQRTIPEGVTHSANMADPENWTDALHGHKYDCFNPDALAGAKVLNGKVVLPSGASYSILVFPGKTKMNPNGSLMSLAVAKKIEELQRDGATIIIDKQSWQSIGFNENQKELDAVWKKIDAFNGKYKLIPAPYNEASFDKLEVPKDVDVLSNSVIAWAHRKLDNGDSYFIANQENRAQTLRLSFRVAGYMPEVWDPVSGTISVSNNWEIKQGRTFVNLPLAANGSAFIVFRQQTFEKQKKTIVEELKTIAILNNVWNVQFDTAYGGPRESVVFHKLQLWNQNENPAIKYYSGRAVYKNNFSIADLKKDKPVFIRINSVYNCATVRVNGTACGTIWTEPYQLDISNTVKQGQNTIEIIVSNTWANRLIGDLLLPENKRVTWTTAPLFLQGKPLLKAGLEGEVRIVQ
ncbi:MAG: discoidin domain-containing protein [Niabella sp.]|nr:discoidin domain-containing protein [Niabella sp.]